LPKLNPGLELANTFGVKILSGKQEVVGFFHRAFSVDLIFQLTKVYAQVLRSQFAIKI